MNTVLTLEFEPNTPFRYASYCEALQFGKIVSRRFFEISPSSIKEIAPGAVVAPLISSGADCIDIGRLLVDADYTGPFCVIADSLPDAAMVRRELKNQFPGLDLRLVSHAEAANVDRPRESRARA